MDKANLNGTTDAAVWASEFMRLFGQRLNEIDEGLMIGWFANAIMAGYDHAARTALEVTKTQSIARGMPRNKRAMLREALRRIYDSRPAVGTCWNHEAAADEYLRLLDIARSEASAALAQTEKP